MCLAIPMKLVRRREFDGDAELRGVQRTVGLMLCPEALPGDYVLVHAGYAIGVIDEVEAHKTLSVIDAALEKELAS